MANKKSWDNMKNIPMTRTKYEKRGNRWVKTESERKLISRNQHENIVNASPFFRRLGGYERNERTYTARGFSVVRNTSISPDRSIKIVRDFDLDNMNYEKAQRNRRYGLYNNNKRGAK